MNANTKNPDHFYEYAESMNRNDSYMLKMNMKDTLKMLQRVTDDDKAALKELLRKTVGEEERYQILPSDTRAVTFFFHPCMSDFVSVEGVRLGCYPDKTPFEITEGNWKLELHTIKEWQRGKWCVQQNTCLYYQGVRVALFANDTLFFKGDYVVSPVLSFANELADYVSGLCKKTKLEAFTDSDFACMAACGMTQYQFCHKVNDGEKKVKKLTEMFLDLNMIDTNTKFAL